jgi:beta-mannanase
MEIPIHRYTWQSQDPVVYINAYRYFMLFNKNQPTNICKVWGPAGDRGSIDWWPGNDVVDFISIAIYGLPDKNITDYNKQELFSDIFSRKFYRMRFAGKPIFITEFGVKGPKEYQNKWMKNAAETLKNNKNVFGVISINTIHQMLGGKLKLQTGVSVKLHFSSLVRLWSINDFIKVRFA